MFNLQVCSAALGQAGVFSQKDHCRRGRQELRDRLARLAGLPDDLLQRAREVLVGLEIDTKKKYPYPAQMSLFDLNDDPLVSELKEVDVNRLTPLEAMNLLAGFVEKAKRR